MNRMNTAGRLLALIMTVLLVLIMAACGEKDGNKMDNMNNKDNMGSMDNMGGDDSSMDNEPKNEDEATAMHKELMAQENAILSANTELWEKVFMAADKGMTMQEDGKNYGDFLLKTIEAAKNQFTADELKLLQGEAEKIRDIENKLTMLEEKYPNIIQKSVDGDINMPTDGSMSMVPDDGSMQKFPAFEGKDLDGNDVKSDELFSGNAVTVVNFWFTTCNPCVGELSDLDALNQDLSKQGGEVIGINSFTLDGDKTAIDEAKAVLDKKGASYRNVYFNTDSEAGKLIEPVYAFPTTYVVDRNGNIVGDPIVGAITEKSQSEALKKQIDKALKQDMKQQ